MSQRTTSGARLASTTSRCSSDEAKQERAGWGLAVSLGPWPRGSSERLSLLLSHEGRHRVGSGSGQPLETGETRKRADPKGALVHRDDAEALRRRPRFVRPR